MLTEALCSWALNDGSLLRSVAGLRSMLNNKMSTDKNYIINFINNLKNVVGSIASEIGDLV